MNIVKKLELLVNLFFDCHLKTLGYRLLYREEEDEAGDRYSLGNSMVQALFFLAQKHLTAGTQQLPKEICPLLPVTVLEQSIFVHCI